MKKIVLALLYLLYACGLSMCVISCKKSSDAAASKPPVIITTGSKNPIVGLVAQGSADSEDSTWVPDNTFPEINAHPNVYVATVIRVQWKQLEPQPGQFNFSVIDAALSNIQAYNLTHKAVTGKLRVFCGVNVPEWVKELSGGPLAVVDPNTGTTIRIARFWTADYRQAWQQLQQNLAAKYDNNALLQEVAVSSCSTLTAEPFVQPFNATTIPVLHAAGFTDAAFEAALSGALDDYSAWKITPVDYTFNQFRPTDSGQPTTDTVFAPALMRTFRTRYGSRAVMANHGLQSPNNSSTSTIYETFLAIGKPIEFQTVSPTVNWDATIALGLTFNPTELEIWDTKDAGGPANVSLTQLQTWAAEIGK